MWAGVDIENLRKSIYGNFYTPEDYSIIDGRDDVSLAEVKRVINKSKKIGDSVTESILRELYDELLYIPPQKTIIPPRELLEQRYNAIIKQAECRLWGKK